MKKFTYILNQYTPDEASHFYHVLHLLEQMARHNVSIALIIEKGKTAPSLSVDNIEVHLQKSTSPLFRFFELVGLLRHLSARGYDRIFVRISTFAALAGVTASIGTGASVFYWNSGTTIEHDRAQPFSWKKAMWYLKSRIPFLLTKSLVQRFVTGPESMGKYYIENAGVDPRKICILYNDIDVARFSPCSTHEKQELRRTHGVDENAQIILFVHRLSPVKRTLFYLPYLLDQLYGENERNLNVKIFILGGGDDAVPLAESLRHKWYAQHVKMAGKVPNRVIQELYQLSDIFINPTYEEGFPRVLLEAMASGLPVVTTDAGGIGDILGPVQLQFMVSKDDREGFYKKLDLLLRSPELARELAEENLITVGRFSTESVARMYVEKIFG